jgi:hypothetical protein
VSKKEFSVCQFFENDTYEYVRRFVSAEEAMTAFRHFTNSVAARMGMVKRVIITDGGDCINAEWIYGKGLVYPLPDTPKEGDGYGNE